MILNSEEGKKEIIEKIMQQIFSKIEEETKDTVSFVNSSYGKDDKFIMFHSSRRTDAILLDCLLTVCPKNQLCVKLANFLLKSKTNGRWGF